MAVKYECDRCKSQFSSSLENVETDRSRESWDLCPDCMKTLREKFMKGEQIASTKTTRS